MKDTFHSLHRTRSKTRNRINVMSPAVARPYNVINMFVSNIAGSVHHPSVQSDIAHNTTRVSKRRCDVYGYMSLAVVDPTTFFIYVSNAACRGNHRVSTGVAVIYPSVQPTYRTPPLYFLILQSKRSLMAPLFCSYYNSHVLFVPFDVVCVFICDVAVC